MSVHSPNCPTVTPDHGTSESSPASDFTEMLINHDPPAPAEIGITPAVTTSTVSFREMLDSEEDAWFVG